MAGTTIKIKQSAIAGKVPEATLLAQGELALNTADQKLYSKDSTGYIFEIGGGSGGGGNEIITHEITATAGQTSFPALYSILNDHVNVYYNGMKLIASDYVITSGTEVVLSLAAEVDDIITIEVIKALNLANGSDIAEHEFTATAGQTSFAIPNGGYNKISDNIEVFVNGIKLVASLDFSRIDGINVVLTDPADLGDEVTIKLIKVVALAGVVNSSGASAILPSGTTADRDASPSAGYLRWNTTLNSTEVYNGTTWEDDNDHTHTISDTTGLQTALDGKVDDSQVLTNVPTGALFTDTETTTTLSVAANILKYTDEVGGVTNIDLSLYLDDTNAAWITAGSLNGTTGVATFTRSDSTSFDVNMAAFLDDTKLTDAEIGAMGYIKVDTNTQLTDAEIGAMGYIKVDTNTQVTVNNTLTSTSTSEALSAKQGKVLQDGKVANSRVLTDVPAGAVFTDTTYSHPATHTIAEVSGLQAELDNIRAEAVAMAIALG